MDRLSYDTTPGGCNATAARVRASVAAPAMRMPQSLRRTTWSAIAAVDLAIDMTCGFPTAMKVHERRPQEGSS
jgi:hypothetical protein